MIAKVILQNGVQSLLRHESLMQESRRFVMKINLYYGIFKADGMRCEKGDVLVRQKGLGYHPGLNVNIDHNKMLSALCAGTVFITKEKTNLDFDHPWVQEADGHRRDLPVYKICFNVVPHEEIGRFRLVDTV